MNTIFLLGFLCGIAIAFLYDQVRHHQRRKQRQRQRRAALVSRL